MLAAVAPGAAHALTYSGPTNFATGTGPTGLTAGLFNGDSNTDLAVANDGSNNVSILLGNGTGGFGGATSFAAGTNPVSVTTGLFNADANMDLAVANDGSNNVSILLGNGTGGFGAATNFAVGAAPAEIAAGKFNGDANVDLALANASNSVTILLGNGAGGFGSPTNYAAGSGPSSVAEADLDQDSHLDVAVPNDISNNISVLLNATPIGYPRSKGAFPLRASLVPAYVQCTSPNSTHGAPLSFGSCNPTAAASGFITVGTPDANGAGAASTGAVTFKVTATDVQIDAAITDVRCRLPVSTTCGAANVAAGPDYAGAVRQLFTARITDHFNAVGGGGGTAAATVQDLTPLPIVIPCSPSGSTSEGSVCSLSTTANTVVPGIARVGDRATWQVGQIRVEDGGADGDPTTAGNTDFARQGVFVP